MAGEQYASLRSMYDLLRGTRCVSELIAEHYRVNWGGGTLRDSGRLQGVPRLPVSPDGHRDAGDQVPRMYRARGNPVPPCAPGRVVPPIRWRRSAAAAPWLSLTWQTQDDFDGYLRDLLVGLAARGMSVFGGPGLKVRLAQRAQERAQFAPVVTDHDEALLKSYPSWIIWVLGANSDALMGAIRDRLAAGEPTYLVHHRGLRDLDRPSTALELVRPSISLRAALEAL